MLLFLFFIAIHATIRAGATSVSPESREKLIKILNNDRRRVNRIGLLNWLPKNAVVLEIGVWKGEFSEMIRSIAEPAELHLLDPWEYQQQFSTTWFGGKRGGNEDGQAGMDRIHNDVAARFSPFRKVHIHRNFSCTLPYLFESEKFDWIYIDGNHYIDGAFVDMYNSFLTVKIGGFLVGDDVHWYDDSHTMSVQKALNNFVAHEKCVRNIATFHDFVLQRVC
jgi:hypothetical protein